jgi:hypothetical protein
VMWNVECGVMRGGFLIRTCLRSSIDNTGRGVVPSYKVVCTTKGSTRPLKSGMRLQRKVCLVCESF